MELTAATRARGHQLGWTDELIARIEASPIKPATANNMALMKITPERVDSFMTMVEKDPEKFGGLTFRFMQSRTEKGIRAVPGPNGLGTPDINIGTYGQVPDVWPYENDTPLGSHPDPSNYAPGKYTIFDKSEVWAEGVDELYEQAIRERWIPATDLDWVNGLGELPEEVERAVGQLATTYSSHGLVEQKIISKWFESISYGFHDVKLFLGTQVYDAGHKVEAFRKRALANGGGLGRSPLGTVYRGWYGALKFSELMVALDVVYKSFEVSLFEAGQDFARTDVEAKLYEFIARDSRRHLEYGKRHLLWYLQHHPRGNENVRFWLDRAEGTLAVEMRHSHDEREALVVLLGNGMEKVAVGVDKLASLRQKQIADYIALLDSVGIDRLPNLNTGIGMLAENPLAI
ncbi:MAG: hypothetical protein ABI305_06600 [Tepidiformaceae bacterium]